MGRQKDRLQLKHRECILGPEKALESEQKSLNCPANLEELAYTQAHMEEQWAPGLEYDAKAEHEYEPPITLLSKPWYSREA
nr:hypothetical protein CFP56_44578 [Quercus suber]